MHLLSPFLQTLVLWPLATLSLVPSINILSLIFFASIRSVRVIKLLILVRVALVELTIGEATARQRSMKLLKTPLSANKQLLRL